ncbi:MAG TPA: anhydro-N-acetylmuramic acid kinase [Pusillimonas sp.]|uniref:anhydro-N-acetylmuramic acid kinase n=1 Tax=Pusillimonas sp. TaxID=3040095 RepID=UPI002C0052E6|nr:anhydro-N-acetylmuramic acid kinase [Pusillimonas sp.]HUH88927.1 anhydro-N-acetylmuramic acid kinase [Pusillimonas sp.]
MPGFSQAPLFIGLMSGTSTDGVDAVLADFTHVSAPRIMGSVSLPMPAALRAEFLALNRSGHDEIARAAQAGNQLARLYAQACTQLLESSGIAPERVCAIGAHGQTVRHNPNAGYSVQINAPALLAELTGIDVVADFRSRDIAAGGQGAPLVPAFHQSVFSCNYTRVVLNLGGIANITILEPGRPLVGFDTGPANALLDLWCQQVTGALYDDNGSWAASGTTSPPLLAALYDEEPWFALPPPKSTGRDLFNEAWLLARLERFRATGLSNADIQATLQSLTAVSVQNAVAIHAPSAREVLVCGGGAFNQGLMKELRRRLGLPLRPTSELGVPVQSVEALAFAWLALAHISGIDAGVPSVTGAKAPRVLGARYRA